MIKIGFCDDDLFALNEISALLDKYRNERDQAITYQAFQSPLELLSEIEKGMYLDILFLDVIMPGEDGIDVAKEIRKYDSNVKIIFLTTSGDFAVQSYTVDAYFYQLKPILEEEFFVLLDAVVSECEKNKQNSLIIRCKNGIVKVDIDRLMYCEILARTLLLYLDDGSVLERIGTLDELWTQLMQYKKFLRPHRSFLINMEYIRNISGKVIVMENNAEIPIPHGKYSDIKDKYLEYVFQNKQVFLS